jgi:hypothetical protein
MTLYRHEKLTADPPAPRISRSTRLRCSVSSSSPASTVDVAYSLDPETRYWFRLPDGSLTKRFTDPDIPITSRPTPIEREVALERRAGGLDPAFFYVTATLVEDGSGSTIRTTAPVTPLTPI